ncbi:MAG TPA: hypothetical protein VJ653_06705, partial [Acidimicrobiales bacterium]|nr:hypothetical protein [Acidimicrobiales bacterium]
MVPQVMRRLLLAVTLLAVTLAACETSKVDPSASVVVSGRVLAADGSPAAGAPVALEREPSVGEVLAGVVVIPLTFFTVCLAQAVRICRGRSIDRTKTGPDGTYSFNLTGSDARTTFGNAADFTVVTGVAGASVTADFKIQTEVLQLPDLPAWQPTVTVAAGRVAWTPQVPGEKQVVFEDGGGQRVWTFDTSGAEVTFDPRILEDTAGQAAVVARTSAGAEGTSVSIRRQSPGVAYRSAAGPPVSRGRPCQLTPCPLTDGDFTNRLPAPPASTSTTAPPAPE